MQAARWASTKNSALEPPQNNPTLPPPNPARPITSPMPWTNPVRGTPLTPTAEQSQRCNQHLDSPSPPPTTPASSFHSFLPRFLQHRERISTCAARATAHPLPVRCVVQRAPAHGAAAPAAPAAAATCRPASLAQRGQGGGDGPLAHDAHQREQPHVAHTAAEPRVGLAGGVALARERDSGRWGG